MNKSNKVSILVPIFGVEKYIERCARSLFEQTYDNIEYIFVNDCSKDNSMKVLESLIKAYPKRKKQIHIINHDINKGLAASRNTAVNYCTGDFIMHVDSDDYLDLDTVECTMREQQRGNYDIVSFGFYKEYKNKTIVQNPINIVNPIEMCKAIIERNAFIGIWGRLYKTKLYKENGIYASEGNNMGEDYQIAPCLMFYADSIYNLQIPKYHYNLMNEGSYVNSISIEKNRQLINSSNCMFAFFEQNKMFDKSVYIGKLKVGIILLENCVKGNLGADIFKEYRFYIRNIPFNYYTSLSIQQKVIFFIKNYYILKALLGIITRLNFFKLLF